MVSTLATEKQAAAIKQRMQEIRTDLPYRVDYARDEVNERVKRLTDWKYHMKQHPLPIVAGAVVLGYLLVPEKASPQKVVVHRESGDGIASEPAKKGLLSGIVGAIATIAMKQATTMAAGYVSDMLRPERPHHDG
ncbi:hypothetical protein FYK55_13950 [Roseiconus nitratireducens]|uniref:DUF3618 domain-containing protein n=1 Tax=Roseiconus nitratireducens TaxID=2605748 RepID=A0A5M6D5K6_9BACT|nr:hypothetical protein [Roseiconus nitratireducens]KAA5542633.1 hypothetical protein FYK55_13950 [Roseiconus nitratireducens]